MVEYAGKTQCLTAWADDLGINYGLLLRRIKRGVSFQEIATTSKEDPLLEVNATGFKGVRKSRGKWIARILIDGERRYLGSFETPELAAAAYAEAIESKKKLAEA